MAKERPAAVRDAAREPISVSGGGTIPLAEVDATYYRLPQESMSRLWVRRTPERFVFDVKAHALMTGQPTETHRLPKAVRHSAGRAVEQGSPLRQRPAAGPQR